MTEGQPEVRGWSGYTRQDGMMIRHEFDGWVVTPIDGRRPVTSCPCCGKPIKTAHEAKVVANMRYPLIGRPRGPSKHKAYE